MLKSSNLGFIQNDVLRTTYFTALDLTQVMLGRKSCEIGKEHFILRKCSQITMETLEFEVYYEKIFLTLSENFF